ncbi:hypothetical protein FZEAL_4989 [Fusarium zealandicum]|uniref:Uncharacterized protein n=1 Tax=Fusarium zealandicum TaxID=1053134 RepID=A0A8H4XLC2_9HYPO|nr:hypothetical protein FZEAL_4989 [Fusarium zealandicum]
MDAQNPVPSMPTGMFRKVLVSEPIASPGAMPPGPSARSSSLASFGHAEDEPEFTKLSSVIPDSQATAKANLTHSRNFSAPREEVSESALAEGFCFAEKQPRRPGQSSRRPNHQEPQTIHTSSYFTQKNVAPQHMPPSPKPAPVTHVRRPLAPLNLPELGLGRSSSENPPASPCGFNSPLVLGSSCQKSSPRIVRVQESSEPVAVLPTPQLDNTRRWKASTSPAVGRISDVGINSQPDFPQTIDMVSETRTPRYTVNDTEPVTSRTQGNGKPFEDLKLPLPHIPRASRRHHHVSPSSTCGDLERPAPQTPRTSSARVHASHSRASSRPIRYSARHKDTVRDPERPQSRTSNISRKRSTIRKPRLATGPDRKKAAMYNVARHWNECIMLTEAERDEANSQIERLEDDIRHAEADLDKSLLLLSEKESMVRASEARCKELEEEGSSALENNQKLSSEVESLRHDLHKSQKSTTNLQEKYRGCRSKLNEAIEEQQDLFLRARGFYQEAKEELQKERDNRTTDASTVDEALKWLENHRISELEEKLHVQQEELVRERRLTLDFRHRIEEQGSLQKMVAGLQSKVDSLVNDGMVREVQDKKQTEMAEEFSSKLDSMMEHLKSSAEDQSSAAELKPILDTLESSIISRLLPEILKAISLQNKTEESNTSFQAATTTQLAEIHGYVLQQQDMHAQDREWLESAQEDLIDLVDGIATRTSSISKTCEETKHHLTEFTQSQVTWQKAFDSQLDTQIIQQLIARGTKIDELDQKLHKVSAEFGRKLDAMKAAFVEGKGKAEEHLQSTVDAVRSTLKCQLDKERAASERDSSESEAIRLTVEAQLKDIRLQLEGMSTSDPEAQLLRETLTDERKQATDLREKLASLECEAEASDELCKRQRQDLEAIATLRTQLENMSQRVPRVETLNTAFNRMVDLNQIMQSTATYLRQEDNWVHDQLKTRRQLEGSEAVQTSITEMNSSCLEEKGPREPTFTSGAQPHSRIVQDHSTSLIHLRRKVVVNSPAMEANSPSPPPSIAQEQLRRREAINPRSILRLSASSSQEVESTKVRANQSQYNRPVMARNSSTANDANPEMIEQIRSGLIQPKPVRRDWKFPTVEDFEKSILSNSSQDTLVKKTVEVSAETEVDEAPAAKKIKLSGSQDGAPSGARLHDTRGARQHGRTRHISLQTYSRMKSE